MQYGVMRHKVNEALIHSTAFTTAQSSHVHHLKFEHPHCNKGPTVRAEFPVSSARSLKAEAIHSFPIKEKSRLND